MANVPCPHCGNPIDIVQLVYANASLKELERIRAQAKFDKKRGKNSNEDSTKA